MEEELHNAGHFKLCEITYFIVCQLIQM